MMENLFKTNTMKTPWRKTTDNVPDPNCGTKPHEVEVLGYSGRWVDPDFTPLGIRICTYSGAGWQCARWNGSQDFWSTIDEQDDEDAVPDYWRPMVEPPKP